MMKLGIHTAIVLSACTAAASAQTPVGGEFRVNTHTTGRQAYAHVAMEPDGDFVVVWASAQDGSDDGVFGQRFDASGLPLGGEFQINTFTTGLQGNPVVAVGSGGDFLVVWESDSDPAPGGVNTDIKGRYYNAAGNPGSEFLVNIATTVSSQLNPRVGRVSNGQFVVVWWGKVGSDYQILARRLDSSGSPISSEFVANTSAAGRQSYPDVALEANGNFVVVWQDNQYGPSERDVIVQRFYAGGSPLASEFLVNTYTTGGQLRPSVSVSPAGGFVIAWRSQFGGTNYDVFARRFNASGNAVANEFVVNTYTTYHQGGGSNLDKRASAQIAHDGGGNFVVTWNSQQQDGSSYGSFAQRFSPSGVRSGAEFRVNTHTTSSQRVPSVASDAVGHFVVAWESGDQDGSGYGIFAQRFGGLAPAALDVDTTGNGNLNKVLEPGNPGETVDAKPSWRNTSAAAIPNVTGTLTNFTGPTGATYTIVDNAAAYGTIAANSTASCGSNCYAVRVTATTRPALHWDASALETLQGAEGQHRWLLHVGASFTDVPSSSPYYRFIETLLHKAVTGGCGATTYCPTASTTREQMAVFVLVAKEGSGYAPPACVQGSEMFTDVVYSNGFCRWIEEAARRGAVIIEPNGCGGTIYCPTGPMTREVMSRFVLRILDPALNPPACATAPFNDVPTSSPYCRWIVELVNRGVVTGCGGGNYCPTAPVTRETMAVFITVAFGLTLYGP
jgi:hypothetical protein